jgi:FkbM family methyltransferase
VDIRAAFRLLSDDESRRQYVAHVRFRLWADYQCLPVPSPDDQYSPSDLLTLKPDEVFVDCGAFDGDSIRRFLALADSGFSRIVAFEPDPRNFQHLKEYVSTLPSDLRLRVTVIGSAVGGETRKVHFSASGSEHAAVTAAGDVEVNCVKLDGVLAGQHPTFLKLDVEGAELDALRGARELIRSQQPIIAACAYHRPNDLWDIPLFLHSIHADYSFYLRSHSSDAWETVIYALPQSRQTRRTA